MKPKRGGPENQVSVLFPICLLFLLGCAFLFSPCAAAAGENIRVAIAENRHSVTVACASGLAINGFRNDSEKKVRFVPSSVSKRPVSVTPIGRFIQMNGKSYRGRLEIRRQGNGLLVINELELEDYLKGVIAAEIPYDWEFEVLKAQAVASRTYAVYRKRTAGAKPYHILATVNGQVYNGRSDERETATRAVRETAGIVITYNGEIIPAFYHASCGGHTEDAFELWGIDEPYLKGVDCDCQEISRYGVWEKRLVIQDVVNALRGQGYRLSGIREIGIDGITRAGRVKQLSIRDADQTISVPAEKFRAAIGYSSIPSVFFETELSGQELVVSGRGLGHGVGLCQWGAREMAQRGQDYKSILAHYYPGTRLIKREIR